MKLLIINSAEPTITEFADNLQQIISSRKVNSEIVNYHSCPTVNFSNYDGVLISGSPQGDDIVEHHQPYFQWIKTYEKPVFGICAGHHITGFMYGAKYLRSVEPESGDQEVEILIDDPIFTGLSSPFVTRQMHNDSVTLPKGFIHLSSSKICVNQAMKHPKKPLYTFQFHPEYLNPQLILNFINICDQYADTFGITT